VVEGLESDGSASRLVLTSFIVHLPSHPLMRLGGGVYQQKVVLDVRYGRQRYQGVVVGSEASLEDLRKRLSGLFLIQMDHLTISTHAHPSTSGWIIYSFLLPA
jgi:hypothetical protein